MSAAMSAEFDYRSTPPDAVQWSEGMLLSPQHMQQNDIYWHGQLRARLASLNPDYWGLLALAIDGRALAEGQLAVQSVAAVLPDGLPVDYPLPDERRARLSLQLDLPVDGRPVRVWLGVPRRGGDAARQDGFMQRYDSLPGEPVVDENTGSNPQPVARLRPNLSLFADESMLPRFSACPLLEVYRDVDGHVRLGSFHAPALRLSAYAFLGEAGLTRRLSALATTVWDKLRELADERGDFENEAFLSQESREHLASARLLAVALPQFDVATAADSHPRAAYQALAVLTGQVTALGGGPLPPKLEPYRHVDCEAHFATALEFISRKLKRVNTAMERLPCARMGESGFARHLPATAAVEHLVIELKPRAGQDFASLQTWLENARIASDDLMNTLRLRRLPGAAVRPLTRAEMEDYDLAPGAALFLVSNQMIEIDGRGIAVLRAGRSFLIQGANDANLPVGILLYRWKREQPDFTSLRDIAILDDIVAAPDFGLMEAADA